MRARGRALPVLRAQHPRSRKNDWAGRALRDAPVFGSELDSPGPELLHSVQAVPGPRRPLRVLVRVLVEGASGYSDPRVPKTALDARRRPSRLDSQGVVQPDRRSFALGQSQQKAAKEPGARGGRGCRLAEIAKRRSRRRRTGRESPELAEGEGRRLAKIAKRRSRRRRTAR